MPAATASVLGAAAVGAAWLGGGPARAYPFMVRHAYVGCGECHADPSGGGLLTEYGRGQAEILLRTPWEERGPDYEPAATKDFLFGAVDLPAWLLLQGDSRSLLVPKPGDFRLLQMQADLRGGVRTDRFLASGSFGWVSEGAMRAWFTSNPTGGNLVAREYWVGYKPTKKTTVRAGRMNLPFGLRSEEHLLYPRAATATDTNDDQQAGAAVGVQGKRVRAEVMGIAGNPQVAPDECRERGAAGFAGYALGRRAEVGVSALWAHAALDPDLRVMRTRTAAGVFGRAAGGPVVVMGEADLTSDRIAEDPAATGFAGFLGADVEPAQGVHLRATGEACAPYFGADPSWAGWLGAQWFLAPHADVRADAAYGSLYCTAAPDPRFLGLAQLHFFL